MTSAELTRFQEIEWFAGRVRDSHYMLSEHVVRALMGGLVTVQDIELVLQGGRVLEEHQHAKRGASYLVVGRNGKKFVHLVCADGGDGWLVVLFAYLPLPPIWANALRRNPREEDENEMDEPYKACYFCGGAMKQITVGNFDYRLEGKLYVIKRVPASLCQECGEKYIAADVGHKLNELIAAQAYTGSEQVGVIDYQ
jgi:YgiT-type zinc finger domain-containing protein